MYILLTTVTACSRAIFFLLEYICFLVVPYLKCFCLVQCLCTSDDGNVEETSKYRLCYYIYHLSEQHRSIWPFWSDMSAFKWKYSIFWRNIGLLTGKWYVNKSVLSYFYPLVHQIFNSGLADPTIYESCKFWSGAVFLLLVFVCFIWLPYWNREEFFFEGRRREEFKKQLMF